MKKSTFFTLLIIMLLVVAGIGVLLELKVFSNASAGFGSLIIATPALAVLLSLFCYVFMKNPDSKSFATVGVCSAAIFTALGSVAYNILMDLLLGEVTNVHGVVVPRTYANAAGERIEYNFWDLRHIIVIAAAVLIAAILAYGVLRIYRYCVKRA